MFRRNVKKFTLVEMLLVLILLGGIMLYFANWNVNIGIKRVPIVFPIGNNFQEISFKCPADKEETCNKFILCPISFNGLEYFNWTISWFWEIGGVGGKWWDLSKYPNIIDLSQFVYDWNSTWNKDLSITSSDQFDGGYDTTKTKVQDVLHNEFCKIHETRSHDLRQFKYSLGKAIWETEPKVYLINGVIYDKHFQPVSWAIDLESWTYIINGITYFN